MGTKLTELRDGCFHAALDDEPMFVLLARDPDAPRLCRNWASQRESEIERGSRPSSDSAKVQAARETAGRMDKWRKENDGVWRGGLFGAAPQPGDTFTADFDGRRYQGKFPTDYGISDNPRDRHTVRQESDEYACSCGMRWSVSEGENHP